MSRCVAVGIAVIALALVAPTPAGAENHLELRLGPEGALPVGTHASNYAAGGGAVVAAGLGLGSSPWISPGLELAYSYVPLKTNASLNIVRGGVGAQFTWPLVRELSIVAGATVGGYYGLLRGTAAATGYGFAYRATTGLQIVLAESFPLFAGALFGSVPGLYDGAGAYLGVGYRLALRDGGGPRRARETSPDRLDGAGAWTQVGDLRVGQVELELMFPVLYKYYDEHPLGTLTIENPTRQVVRNVEVRLDAERIVDNPKLSASIAEIGRGERVRIDLYALFNDHVLTITEGTRIAASVEIRYEIGSSPNREAFTVTLGTHDRNALQWDDDAKIAAFVTAKDDEIQRLGKNMAALSRSAGVDAVNQELQLAMAVFALMEERGLAYVVDPTSAYADFSANSAAVDYVQFPRQTMEYRAGDCDDLSATYNALLESVGVRSAFVTVPGHIFSAFEMNVDADQARRTFNNPQDFIFGDDGSVFVPVEVTVLDRGFMEAWTTGARQWREHSAAGAAGLFRTSDAWRVYEPVAFSVSEARIPNPDAAAVETAFRRALDQFVSVQIYSEERELLERLRQGPANPRLRNRLGVLYARYGRIAQARDQFSRILRLEDHVPALVNMANLAYLEGDMSAAAGFYDRALAVDPYNTTALLGAARVSHALERYDECERRYRVLTSLDPDLAERFSYLSPGGSADATARASNAAQVQRTVVWEEETE